MGYHLNAKTYSDIWLYDWLIGGIGIQKIYNKIIIIASRVDDGGRYDY